MIVRELFAKLGFKVDPTGLKKFESGLDQAKAGLKGLAAIVTVGGASVLALASTTAHAAEEMKELADRTGLGSTEFQRLAYAAGTTNVSAEELAQGLTFLNKNMFEARHGGKEAAKAFALLGPNVASAVQKGRPAAEVFGLISDAIAKTHDPAKRTALSMAILGRSGARLIPILSKGSATIAELGDNAEAMGMVFDHDAIESSENFIKSFKVLGSIAKGTARIIGVGLMKAMQPFLDNIVAIRLESMKAGAGKLKEFFVTIFKVSKATAAFLFNMYKAVNLLLGPFGGLLGVIKGLVIAFAAFKALQLVSGIGQIAQAVWGLVSTYKAMGTASLIAQAKAVALPLLIGLAIIGLLLLLEDLYVFMTGGGDSIIGLFAEKFPKAFEALKAVIGPTFMPLINLIKGLTDGTLGWVDALKLIGETILNAILMPMRLVSQTLGPLIEMLGKYTNSPMIASIGQDIASGGKLLTAQGLGQTFGIGQGGVNQSNQVQQNINVTVGEGDDAAQIAKKVGEASSGGLNDVFRQAGRTLAPGVAY